MSLVVLQPRDLSKVALEADARERKAAEERSTLLKNLPARISDASLELQESEVRFQRCRQSLLEDIFHVRQTRFMLASEAEELSDYAATMAADTASAEAAHQ